MRMALFIVIATVCASVACGAESDAAAKLTRLDQSAGCQTGSGFDFSISPDGQWLVFFMRVDAPDRSEIHYLYGHLRVMNLHSGEVHRFEVAEDQAAMYPMRLRDLDADASWAPNSSMCVLPPPPQVDRRIVIKFAAGEKPTVSFLPHPHQPRKRGESAPDEQIKLPEKFTCSDCSPRTNDVELLKKHIPKEFLIVGNNSPNEGLPQAVSFDGTRIFYQKGLQGKHNAPEGYTDTTLYEIDVNTGKERVLITHRGDSPMIDQLRPSPDGKQLAYQIWFGYGQNFISIPEIYVLNLTTLKAEKNALGSGTMHWTSTSDKLIFYRRHLEGPPSDYLWVAEFAKPEPSPKPQ